MDPSSRRFMWAASAPRGSAWSCLDASALAENYYNSHHHAMRRRVPARPAQAAKGLKLILRHNSLYAQATDAAAGLCGVRVRPSGPGAAFSLLGAE
jgi:hypothetical protein